MRKKVFSLMAVMALSMSSLASAYVDTSRDIWVDGSCSSMIYVQGSVSGIENGFYPETSLGRSYFDWYTNGQFVGSKLSQDTSAPIYTDARTTPCTHNASNTHTMAWSQYFEFDLFTDPADFSGEVVYNP
ncbi:hypothetical protein [Cohnella rhizosphaerae]|uniref:Secreted protein n=1 Tax=Cohnella rhizosphaerae TaxID=1457232 RepID=A0A9X4KUW6_9BACL|nr:hypothetical protein [Cohnella rhizosphaerae]MDG0811596.1 hypothetical protein [Cohnella rhizosphaerae]